MNEKPADATVLDEMAKGYFRGKVLCAAVRLGIADAIADGDRSLHELAQATSAKPDSLYRLLRALASIGIVTEAAGDRYSLTPLGQLLRKDVPGSKWASIVFWADLLADSWTYLADCVRSGENATAIMAQRGVTSRWSIEPDSVAIFHTVFSEAKVENLEPFVSAHDFSRYQVIADLGGGGGNLLCAILGAHPDLHGILVERKEAIAGAVTRIDQSKLSDRCAAVEGDLLQQIPRSADAFILKSVLHGYDDKRARQILQNCLSAAPRQTLLIIEFVLPATIAQADQRLEQMLMGDINMLAVTGGRERSEGEWRSLLTSSGYTIKHISPVPGQASSIIECAPAD